METLKMLFNWERQFPQRLKGGLALSTQASNPRPWPSSFLHLSLMTRSIYVLEPFPEKPVSSNRLSFLSLLVNLKLYSWILCIWRNNKLFVASRVDLYLSPSSSKGRSTAWALKMHRRVHPQRPNYCLPTVRHHSEISVLVNADGATA